MTVHPTDILFGRGRPFQSHPGNMRMKRILEPYISVYQAAPRHLKTGITKHVIRVLRQQGTSKEEYSAQKTMGVLVLLTVSDKSPPESTPTTRFLKKKQRKGDGESDGDSKTIQWVEASEVEIFSKVSHCLRKKDLPSPSFGLSGCKQNILMAQQPHNIINSTWKRPVMAHRTSTPSSQEKLFFPRGLIIDDFIKPVPLRRPSDRCYSCCDSRSRGEQSRADIYKKAFDVPDLLFENSRSIRRMLEPNPLVAELVFMDPGDIPPSPSIFD